MEYEDSVQEMVTEICDLDNERYFTVARVMENGQCAELHYNSGKAIIEYAIKESEDSWLTVDEEDAEWFNLNSTEDEIFSILNTKFDEYFLEKKHDIDYEY